MAATGAQEGKGENKGFLHFIKEYCHGEEDIVQRVEEVHRKALKVYPYKCVMEKKYLSFRMYSHFEYASVVEQVGLHGKRLLDIGCCMGTDVRRLLMDAAAKGGEKFKPAEQVFGVDLEPGFLELGFEMFRDEARLKSNFFTADLLANPKEPETLVASLEPHRHAFDYVYAGSVLHLFDESDIILFCKRVRQLLKPGGVFFGRNVGRLDQPGAIPIAHEDLTDERLNLRTSAEGVRARSMIARLANAHIGDEGAKERESGNEVKGESGASETPTTADANEAGAEGGAGAISGNDTTNAEALSEEKKAAGESTAKSAAPTATAAETHQLRYLHTTESLATLLQELGYIGVDVRQVAWDMPVDPRPHMRMRAFVSFRATVL